MPYSTKRKSLSLWEPAHYRIGVQGYLDENWSDRLSGMHITGHFGDKTPITTIAGRVKDQAELIGVLNSLYELRMPLLSVEYFPEEGKKNKENI